MGFVRLFCITLLLTGCGNYHESYVKQGDKRIVDRKAFKTFSFEAIRAIVFAPKCLHCHSSEFGDKGKVNLETYAKTFPIIQQIKASVERNQMPYQEAPLSEEDKLLLFKWIEHGAPETSDILIPDNISLKEPMPGFGQVSARLFQPYCSRCHSMFSDYDKVVKNIDKIGTAIETEKMPKNSFPVPAPLRILLVNWVSGGMPMGFEEVQTKIFIPHCTRCHGNLASYDVVARNISHIQLAVSTNEMPKESTPLSDELKAQLKKWVDAGMPK